MKPGKGTRLRCRVEALDGHAAAVARDADGRRVRVPFGVPGDEVDVEVVAVGRKDVWTRIVEVVTPSPDRVQPVCFIATRCGTCPWQHVAYEAQLAAKRDVLAAAFSKHEALESVEIAAPIGVSVTEGTAGPIGYRTKVQMPFGGPKHAVRNGFWAPRSHGFVGARTCPVQHPLAESIRSAILEVLNRHGLEAYDEREPRDERGDLRTLLVRVAQGTGQVGAVLVVRSLDAVAQTVDPGVLGAELAAIDGLTGVWANENDTEGNAVLGPRTVHLGGAQRLLDRVGGVELLRTPTSFFQTNHEAAEALVGVVRDMLPDRMDHLVDVYAGGGLFSATLASRCERLSLIETNEDAVAAAQATLAHLGVQADIHAQEAQTGLPTVGRVDAAVVDPPRAGMGAEAAQALSDTGAEHVVLVSCRPKSLVRDLLALVHRYEVVRVQPVDMFPHTPHLEVACLLRLRGPDKPVPA